MLEVLRTDESLQIDEILELLETQLTSSEVFTALFELEMAGRMRQLAGQELRADDVRSRCDSQRSRLAERASHFPDAIPSH